MVKYHQMKLKDVQKEFGSGPKGLSEDLAQKRLKLDGPNLLQAPKKENPIIKFLKQFANFLIILLLVTAVVCFFIPDHRSDAFVILAVVTLNAIMGFIQEFRAAFGCAYKGKVNTGLIELFPYNLVFNMVQ